MARDVGEITREDIEKSNDEFNRLLNNYINSLDKMREACTTIGIKINIPKYKHNQQKGMK